MPSLVDFSQAFGQLRRDNDCLFLDLFAWIPAYREAAPCLVASIDPRYVAAAPFALCWAPNGKHPGPPRSPSTFISILLSRNTQCPPILLHGKHLHRNPTEEVEQS